MVAAGFLLILPDGMCIRLEYGLARQGREANPYAALKDRDPPKGHSDGTWGPSWKNWPLTAKAEQAYLKLERRGKILYPSLSPDGEKWTLLVGGRGLQKLPAKLKVGLAVYSTSTEPSKVRFDHLKVTRGKKHKR